MANKVKVLNHYNLKKSPAVAKLVCGWLDILLYIRDHVSGMEVVGTPSGGFMIANPSVVNAKGHHLTIMVNYSHLVTRWYDPEGSKGKKYYEDSSSKNWNKNHKDLTPMNAAFDTESCTFVRIETEWDRQNPEEVEAHQDLGV